MRMAVSFEDGLGLDGDRCMRDTPTILSWKATHKAANAPIQQSDTQKNKCLGSCDIFSRVSCEKQAVF